MPRFVVLKHAWNGVHFDLMLEHCGILRTWALPEPPGEGRTIAAKALPDHRTAYLDYEGPISQGRGSVSRIERGRFHVIAWADDRIEVEIHGDQWNGRLALWRAETGDAERADEWLVRFGKRD
jgi:hypothetical protein